MSGAHDSEIARMYRDGFDTKAISVAVNISTRSVCRALIREGVRDLKSQQPSPDVDPRMLELLVDGASYVDVAETFDVPVKWLRETYPGYGWDGQISGSLVHALRKPELRLMYNEIKRMPLDEQHDTRRSA